MTDLVIAIVPINLIETELEDSIIVCNNTPTPLNPDGNPLYTYVWMPVEGLDDPSSPNPLANPEQTTTYTVQISDVNALCAVERSVTVVVPPPITLSVPSDTSICEAEFLLYANSAEAISFAWSEDPSFSSIFSTDPETLVSLDDESTFYVRVTDVFGCSKEETIELISNQIKIDISGASTVCIGGKRPPLKYNKKNNR